jgi:S1-C subfamily serine protease
VAPPAGLQPIPTVGSSADLKVGQAIFAIGNPFGYDQTLTQGIISALDRPIQAREGSVIYGCIQVDAAINPGNSGGPLLDSHGRLIGMNTAIYSPSGASAGIGFAIPVDTINDVVPGLISPKTDPPRLGIVLRDIPQEKLVMVETVYKGTGADAAGIIGRDRLEDGSWGDVIVAVGGKKVSSKEDVTSAIAGKKRGELVDVVLLRGLPAREQRLTVKVRLAAVDHGWRSVLHRHHHRVAA